eukprot:TRINITY_DN4164_c0_g1_i1.p1 TRINITY_DN4164_c0_g1~~TRINITY_DN4164_c0_g1_i1.p1  ORF type:complete len:358 (+),score=67.00 TRINITY_DN4164_c0_g1_i1:116-1189(+)
MDAFITLPHSIIGPLSFVCLCAASWCVGEGGEILGKKYDASILGGIIIAWLNTAPEAIFFITALQSGNPRFAVGAVSGSSVVVCTVALGACLWIGGSAIKSGQILLQPAVKTQCYILLCSVLITAVIATMGFNLLAGILGILYYCGFLYYSLTHKEEEKEEEDEEAGHTEEMEEDVPVSKGIMYLIAGATLIFAFSSPFINAVVAFASYLQVNPILLAFFLAPIASEAPEILEGIALSRKGNPQSINIAFSNLIGGTVTKTTLLCGIFCIYGVAKDFKWESPSYSLSLFLLGLCAASAAAIGSLVHAQTKWHGALLFVLFVITGITQYSTNKHFGNEVFVDESFAHDDEHHVENIAR